MEGPLMSSKTRTFTSSEIFEITSNFKTMIGKGGFGEVYFGTLKDGTDVAVKVLLSSSEQCRKAFLTEAKLLTEVCQGNLVSLVGYCDEDGKEALILDYMPNGNLKQHLSEKSERVLIWIQRLLIALDVAYGLEYLHGQKPPIVHRDLKPDNILFNEYMQAKIVDFGLSKAFATESASHISTRPGGTPGYIDPESWNIGRISKSSDMYSFGIVLLELVTGMPAIITRGKDDKINIINWIDPLFKRREIQKIVDPRLNGKFNINVARKTIKIAMSCVKPIRERPNIIHVLTQLKECLDVEMNSRVLDETGRINLLVRLYRNIRQNQKGAIMRSMEEQQPLNSRNVNLRNVRIFTPTEVAIITSNFKKVIGEGEFGKVYLGTLHNDTHVAVKILSVSPLEDFRTKVELLSHISHKNVVSLVGYCNEINIKALIYQFMPNGDLRGHLSAMERRASLCWNMRLQIAIDIAYGLEYLQRRTCGRTFFIVHRNLITNNILLTEDMRGKIGGFGLPTVLATVYDQYKVVGTVGYVAPEYLLSGELNKKTDLYSFGIILLELLTGRPACDLQNLHCPLKDRHDPFLADLVRPIMETGDIERIVDPSLQGNFNINAALKVAKLAMSCASESAKQRPDMSHVLVELKECLALEMGSRQTQKMQIDIKESQYSDESYFSDESCLSPR